MNQNIADPTNSSISLQIIQLDKDGQPLAVQGSTLQSLGELTIVTHAQVLSADATVVKAEPVSGAEAVLTEAIPVHIQPTPAAPNQITPSSQLAVADGKTAARCDDSTTGILVNNEKHNGNNVPAVEVDARGAPVNTLWPLIDTSTGMLFCTRCSYTTDKKQNWYKHRQTHLGNKRHQCPDCAYETGSASNMKRHQLQHSGNKMFKCNLCEASYHQKTHLQRHLQKAHVARKYPCSAGCGFSAVSEEELSRHFDRKHKELVLLPGPEGVQVTKRRYMCPHCNFIDVDRKVVQQHIKFHSRRERGGTGNAELKRFCTLCSFVTDCESKLKRHQLVHNQEKPFLCRLCPYKANQREHVVRHLRSKHQIVIPPNRMKGSMPKTKPVAVAVSTNENMEHTVSNSENRLIKQSNMPGQLTSSNGISGLDKLFACNFCTLTFSKLLSLYKHVHAQHQEHTANLSPLSCVICDFSGANHKTLLAHMRRHTASEEAKMAATAMSSSATNHPVQMSTSALSSSSSFRQRKMKTNTITHTANSATPPNTKTVMLELGQGLDIPVIVDLPKTTTTDDEDEEEDNEEEPMTVAHEHEVLMQQGSTENPVDEIMFLGDLTAVSADDAADLQASIAGTQVIQIEDNEEMVGDMKDLVPGDVIEINGETYKVEMSPSTVMK